MSIVFIQTLYSIMRIASHYVLAIVLSLALPATIWLEEQILFDIGWHLMTVIYSLILLLQLSFYALTTNFKLGRTTMSFVLNFLLWTFEQVGSEMIFRDTWFYQEPGLQVIFLGATLWATNKLVLDKLLTHGMRVNFSTSKLERLLNISGTTANI